MTIRGQHFKYGTSAVSEKQFDEHIKLYMGYVDKVNSIGEALESGADLRRGSNKTYSAYRGLKKGETYALDGVILHEYYFYNISAGEKLPGEHFTSLTQKYFRSFENWAEDFVACAKSARGWCVAAWEQRSRRLVNILMDAHDCGCVCAAHPLVVLDMYEHAYFTDFGTDSNAYIKKFMENINWQIVENRVKTLGEGNL